MSGQKRCWTSERKAFSLANPVQIEFVNNESPRGPNGGRMVIDTAYIVVEGTITVATGTLDGRDVARLVGQLAVEQHDDVQRVITVSGAAHRLIAYDILGPERYNEHATLPIAANTPVALRLPVPFHRPWQARPNDYSLGVELLRKVIVTPNTLAGAATGTAVLSADNLGCYIEYWGHEESYLEHKALDGFSIIDFTSTQQVVPSLAGPMLGMYIASLTGTAAALAGGGGSTAAVTSFRVEQLAIPQTPRARILAAYRQMRGRGNASAAAVAGEVWGDPVTENRLLPVFLPSIGDVAPWEGYTRDAMQLKIDIEPAVSNLQIISRYARKRSALSWALSCKAFGLDPDAEAARVKAVGANGVGMGLTEQVRYYAPIRTSLPGR